MSRAAPPPRRQPDPPALPHAPAPTEFPDPPYALPAPPPRRQPDPPYEVPVEKEYLVVGPRTVGGANKGETVTLSLTAGAEAALIEAGHIQHVRPSVAGNEVNDG